MSNAAAAEAHTRLVIALRDIVSIFEENHIHERSIQLLNDFIERNLGIDFLNLAESYGRSMAFIDHDFLLNKIYIGWTLLLDGCTIDFKVVFKRIKILKEDKKTDPAVLLKQENIKAEIEQKKAIILVGAMKIRAMLSIPLIDFKRNPAFDYKQRHQENVDEARRKVKLVKDTLKQDALSKKRAENV